MGGCCGKTAIDEDGPLKDSMEDLPDDALLVILNKLAMQDLLSLFQVACVSKRFYQIITARITACPSFWEQAFYGPILWQDDSFFHEQKSAELSARLETLQIVDQMPYKKLVELRTPSPNFLTAFPIYEAFEPKQPRPPNFEHSCFQATSLFVIRLRGSLLLWGFKDHVSLEAFKERPRLE